MEEVRANIPVDVAEAILQQKYRDLAIRLLVTRTVGRIVLLGIVAVGLFVPRLDPVALLVLSLVTLLLGIGSSLELWALRSQLRSLDNSISRIPGGQLLEEAWAEMSYARWRVRLLHRAVQGVELPALTLLALVVLWLATAA
jgi:hypothetical protein